MFTPMRALCVGGVNDDHANARCVLDCVGGVNDDHANARCLLDCWWSE